MLVPSPSAPNAWRKSSWSSSGTPSRSATTSSENGFAYALRNSHLPVGDELVDVAIGQPPHEVLVLLEPLGSQQPRKHGAGVGVMRRIHRDHVLDA